MPARTTTAVAAHSRRCATAVLTLTAALAAAADRAGDDHFERGVRPLLAEHCWKCHSAAAGKAKGGLALDSRAGLLRGGESGAAIVPGDPARSLLMRAVRHEDPKLSMPPKAALPRQAVEDLATWIAAGAPWPAAAAPTGAAPAASATAPPHWAFQPLRAPATPAVRDAAWPRDALDRFVLARLEQAGLRPAPPAPRLAWLRRVTVDLTGLPPTPAEIDGFAADRSPEAEAAVVDRLLASPAYGERWARHWLDVVRYAESDGFEFDKYRPEAWRYRDWVIAALNADLPYDRFVQLQLAGDELAPEDPDALVATGFLRLGTSLPGNNVSFPPPVKRQHDLDEMTEITGLAFLGLTIGCAKCHDHKYEPIPQADYFRMQAYFAGATPVDRALPAATPATAGSPTPAELRQRIAAIAEPARERLVAERLARLPAAARAAYAVPEARRTPAERAALKPHEKALRVDEKDIAAALAAADRERLDELRERLAVADGTKAGGPKAHAIEEKPAPATLVLKRGDLAKPGDEVAPGVPSALAAAAPGPAATAGRGRRSLLAAWLTRPDHPLTARVIANRVWQHHLGRGIVPTPNDLGVRGDPPGDQALLDHLASELVRAGWRLKPLHRRIVLSATYRQSSVADAAARERDPDNRLWSRVPSRRLEAEALRDALLAAGGLLQRDGGGPGIWPKVPANAFAGLDTKHGLPEAVTAGPAAYRRSVYITVRRNARQAFLDAFDFPSAMASAPVRQSGTSPTQALVLLDAEVVVEAAQGMAKRLESEAKEVDGRIRLAWRLAYARQPEAAEIAAARAFLAGNPLSELCRALFNSNEFIHLD